ncbi:hypothetical protein EYF80_007073 [Liparis tanakae]|uniref:Uncharacterized protein n=1 Tax=Liparis tanakae TaxID=230148 RepID=A0A4Z2IX63_9TELE|nr:hypothetical protein EYF80_007073 [Liparis tanakae]
MVNKRSKTEEERTLAAGVYSLGQTSETQTLTALWFWFYAAEREKYNLQQSSRGSSPASSFLLHQSTTERQPLGATLNINLTRITEHPAEIEVHLGATTGMPADSMDARGAPCGAPRGPQTAGRPSAGRRPERTPDHNPDDVRWMWWEEGGVEERESEPSLRRRRRRRREEEEEEEEEMKLHLFWWLTNDFEMRADLVAAKMIFPTIRPDL